MLDIGQAMCYCDAIGTQPVVSGAHCETCMATKHLVWAFGLEYPWQSVSERMVFLEAAYRADNHGIVRATQEEIAAEAGLSRRTVGNAFRSLVESHFLHHLGHGRYGLTSSEYRERVNDPAWPDFLAWAESCVKGYMGNEFPSPQARDQYGMETTSEYRKQFAIGVQRQWLTQDVVDTQIYRLSFPLDELGIADVPP